MKKYKNAFTMIELVFVIVILGILAAVAIPRLSATRTDAEISKGRADIASIRTSIVTERQTRLITGSSVWITKLHGDSGVYFDGNGSSNLLMYGITPKVADGHWHGYAADGTKHTYKYRLLGADNIFEYDPAKGTFKCTSGANCSDLTD